MDEGPVVGHRAFGTTGTLVVLLESHEDAESNKFSPVPESGAWSLFGSRSARFRAADRSSSCARAAIVATATAPRRAETMPVGAASVRDVCGTSGVSLAGSIIGTETVRTASADADA